MENFGQFRWKNCQKCKIRIFRNFTKIGITRVQNDLGSWNLAKLWRIMLSKIAATQRFLIILVFLKILPSSSKIWPKCLRNGQILGENGKISINTHIIKKRCVAILDNIMLYNLAKFQQIILDFCKIPETLHFVFLSTFSPKLVNIFPDYSKLCPETC